MLSKFLILVEPNFKRSHVIEKLEEKRREGYLNQLKESEENFKAVVDKGNKSLALLAKTAQGELKINYDAIVELEASINPTSEVTVIFFVCLLVPVFCTILYV